MKAKKFEQQFDEGVDITASLDLSRAKRVMQAQKRVNVDFPIGTIESLYRKTRVQLSLAANNYCVNM